jgi:hypothetical protein
MATVPGIMVEIGANVARMQSDMRQITSTMSSTFGQIESMAKKVGAAIGIGFGVNELVNFGKEALDLGERMAKLSQSAGITVENLSALNYAARLANVDLDSLAKMVGRLSRNMLEAQTGTGDARDAFVALGISVKDSSGNLLSSDRVMALVADKFAGMEDGAGKTALAMKIFGKAGAEIIPMLNQGSAGLEQMRAEAEKLGLVMSTETAQQMERINDNFKRLKLSTMGIAINIMDHLSPTLENLTNIMIDAKKGAKDFSMAADAIAVVLKSMASAAVVASAAFQDVGGYVGATAAHWLAVVKGDFAAAAEIQKAQAQDVQEIWAKAGDRLTQIWSKEAEDALRAGDKIKKGLAPAPALPTEEEKEIKKRIKALFEEVEAMNQGTAALELYKKGLHNASVEQKDYALYLINEIDARTRNTKALLEGLKAYEDDQKAIQENEDAIQGMIDALKVEAITAAMTTEEIAKFQLTLKGATEAQVESIDTYQRAIRAAKEYKEEIDLIKGIIEETKSPMDRFEERIAEIQKLLDKGFIGGETARRAWTIAWDKMMGGGQDKVDERERILIDFADRVRAQDAMTADAAIYQIDRQAAIFKKAGADDVAVAQWAAREKIKASREWSDGAIRALYDYSANATNLAKGAETAITNGFKKMEDAIVEFAMTGKASFSDFANSVIRDLIRIMVQKTITGPLAGAGYDWLKGIFGGGGANAPAASTGYSYMGPESPYGIMHGGGIVGASSVPMRYLAPPHIWGAPRLHGGLQPDEFPAVLKRGEGVFTPTQMRAMGPGEVNVRVNIINQSPRVRAEVREGDNGRGSRDITVIISEIAGAEARRQGSPLNQGIRSIGGRTPLIRR